MNSKKTVIAALALAFSAATAALSASLPNVASSPPMGWNSWNWFGKPNISETLIKEVIDAMAESGLRDAGYNYIIVDGGWRDVKLGPGGELLSHPERFPGGMKMLADYAHERGFKFGVHFVPGTHDCAGDPVGSLGREEIHMRQFVEWGLDFLKVDLCRNDNGWNDQSIKDAYTTWSRLVAKAERPMLYSISAYKFRDWFPQTAHMARTTWDIRAKANIGARFEDGNRFNDRYLSVMGVAEENDRHAKSAGKGYWNDPDMLVTGGHGLTADEQQSNFALWCIMSSPLLLGNDPRELSSTEKALLTNREAIAINQDPTEQGRRIKTFGTRDIWSKKLQNNRHAVLLLNRKDDEAHTMRFHLSDLGLKGEWHARDVFNQQDLGTLADAISLEAGPHGSRLFILSPKTE